MAAALGPVVHWPRGGVHWPRGADGSPRRANGSPHGADDSPRRANGSPHEANDSPRRANDSPRRANGLPRRANGLPHGANGRPNGPVEPSPGLRPQADALGHQTPQAGGLKGPREPGLSEPTQKNLLRAFQAAIGLLLSIELYRPVGPKDEASLIYDIYT